MRKYLDAFRLGLALFNAILDDEEHSINEAMLMVIHFVPTQSERLHIARRLDRLSSAVTKYYYSVELERDAVNAAKHANLN